MVPAVVMFDVGPMMELGLRDVLRRAGIAIVDDPRAADAALISLDVPTARERADDLLHAHLGLAVIGCSAVKDEMLIIHLSGDPLRSTLSSATLRSAVRRAAATRAQL